VLKYFCLKQYINGILNCVNGTHIWRSEETEVYKIRKGCKNSINNSGKIEAK
jgi:hypothetical protein